MGLFRRLLGSKAEYMAGERGTLVAMARDQTKGLDEEVQEP